MIIPDPWVRDRDGADALCEGHYLIQRRRSDRVDMPVRIWFGPPIDEDGAELDRSPRWQLAICGVVIDTPTRIGGIWIETIADVWPACASEPITPDDYAFRIARQSWAALNDPDDPFGTPAGRIDPMTAPLPFLGA